MKRLLLIALLTLSWTFAIAQHLVGTDLKFVNGSSSTAGTVNGTAYFDTGSGLFQFRQSGGWVSLGSGGTVSSVALTVPSFLSISGSPVTTSGTLAISLSGTALPIANGGTAVTSVTTSPTASSFAGWDASKNFSANSLISSFNTSAAAGGSTTLTVSSPSLQYRTGTSTETITLPVTSTLSQGLTYTIDNTGNTGTLTVNSSGANLVQTMVGGSKAFITCILTSGTTAASWGVTYLPPNPMTTVGDIIVGGTVTGNVAAPSRLAAGASNTFLGGNGAGVTPSYQQPTTNMILATATNDNATAGNQGESIVGTPVTSYTNFTTTATYKNISSIVLTAGDWIIRATFTLFGNGATITTTADAIFVVSTTTASATGAVEGKSIYYIDQNNFALSSSAHISGTMTFRVSISGGTTYYLNGQGTFTVGNMQYVGSMEATRPR